MGTGASPKERRTHHHCKETEETAPSQRRRSGQQHRSKRERSRKQHRPLRRGENHHTPKKHTHEISLNIWNISDNNSLKIDASCHGTCRMTFAQKHAWSCGRWHDAGACPFKHIFKVVFESFKVVNSDGMNVFGWRKGFV